ncbi:hypothetical protein C0J52_04622 [Blattella germanica]|nr:hypothetical protein C0J52_04622 [Blattella germanica]
MKTFSFGMLMLLSNQNELTLNSGGESRQEEEVYILLLTHNIRKDIGRNLTCYGPLEVEGGGGEYRSQRNEYTWNQSVSYVLEAFLGSPSGGDWKGRLVGIYPISTEQSPVKIFFSQNRILGRAKILFNMAKTRIMWPANEFTLTTVALFQKRLDTPGIHNPLYCERGPSRCSSSWDSVRSLSCIKFRLSSGMLGISASTVLVVLLNHLALPFFNRLETVLLDHTTDLVEELSSMIPHAIIESVPRNRPPQPQNIVIRVFSHKYSEILQQNIRAYRHQRGIDGAKFATINQLQHRRKCLSE